MVLTSDFLLNFTPEESESITAGIRRYFIPARTPEQRAGEVAASGDALGKGIRSEIYSGI